MSWLLSKLREERKYFRGSMNCRILELIRTWNKVRLIRRFKIYWDLSLITRLEKFSKTFTNYKRKMFLKILDLKMKRMNWIQVQFLAEIIIRLCKCLSIMWILQINIILHVHQNTQLIIPQIEMSHLKW